MYCSNCGAKVSGNFCSICGTKSSSESQSTAPTSDLHRTLESRYEDLVKRAEVRRLIESYASQSSSGVSADEFLKLADLAFKPLTGVSLHSISQIVVPVFQKMGIKTGRSYTHTFPVAAPDAIVKVLCSLAKNGYPLQSVEQGNNGLLLMAKLNSDLWTWGGDIVITVEDLQSKALVSIDVKIKGQLYDWGKSKSVIEKISGDMVNIKP